MRELKQLIILPRVPSKLIRIAVEDMRQTIEEGVNIDMSNWGVGKCIDEPNKCSVCMAGAVMLQRGLANNIVPDDFLQTGKNQDQYDFLDNIRVGNVASAMKSLGIQPPNVSSLLSYVSWQGFLKGFDLWGDVDNEEFFSQMEDLAKEFEIIGL